MGIEQQYKQVLPDFLLKLRLKIRWLMYQCRMMKTPEQPQMNPYQQPFVKNLLNKMRLNKMLLSM